MYFLLNILYNIVKLSVCTGKYEYKENYNGTF